MIGEKRWTSFKTDTRFYRSASRDTLVPFKAFQVKGPSALNTC
jgi:hypothetical protein